TVDPVPVLPHPAHSGACAQREKSVGTVLFLNLLEIRQKLIAILRDNEVANRELEQVLLPVPERLDEAGTYRDKSATEIVRAPQVCLEGPIRVVGGKDQACGFGHTDAMLELAPEL